jgi:hypothetical protein
MAETEMEKDRLLREIILPLESISLAHSYNGKNDFQRPQV